MESQSFPIFCKTKCSLLLLQLLFCLAIFLGCNERTITIKNSTKPNFSDLYHLQFPDLLLFDYHNYFPIETNTNSDYRDHNSILYLVESANNIPIERENLQKILPKSEFEDLLQNHCEPRTDSLICNKVYYAFGRIVTDNFVLLELNIRECDEMGGNYLSRRYSFEWRTYSLDGQPIAKVEFAKWNEVNKEFFSGKLTQDWRIKTWSEEGEIANYWIDEMGKIHSKD